MRTILFARQLRTKWCWIDLCTTGMALRAPARSRAFEAEQAEHITMFAEHAPVVVGVADRCVLR